MRYLKFFITTVALLQFTTAAHSSNLNPIEDYAEPDLTSLIPLPENVIGITLTEISDVLEFMHQKGANELAENITYTFLLLQDQERKRIVMPHIKKRSFLFKECLCAKLSNFLLSLDESVSIYEEIKESGIKKFNKKLNSYQLKEKFCKKNLNKMIERKMITREKAQKENDNLNKLQRNLVSELNGIDNLTKMISTIRAHMDYIKVLVKELEA